MLENDRATAKSETDKNVKKQLINSLTRGLIMLEAILEKGTIGITEASTYLGVNKSSAYRILSTLEAKGYVKQDPVTLKYKLDIIYIKYAESVLEDLKIRDIAKPYLVELCNKTRETAHLCTLFQNKALFIEQEKSSEIISVNTHIGLSEDVHCSAVGKVLVAFLPDDKRDNIISSMVMKPYTRRTITNPDALRFELKKVLENGFAIDDEEMSSGVRCIAAPIMNHKGEVIAAIGISGTVYRIRVDNLQEYISTVVEVASKISQSLGYS
jgi:DNA-binding IclR family transcriptional regulator